MIPRYHRFIPPEYCSIIFKVMASGVEPDSTSAATLRMSLGPRTPLPLEQIHSKPPGKQNPAGQSTLEGPNT